MWHKKKPNTAHYWWEIWRWLITKYCRWTRHVRNSRWLERMCRKANWNRRACGRCDSCASWSRVQPLKGLSYTAITVMADCPFPCLLISGWFDHHLIIPSKPQPSDLEYCSCLSQVYMQEWLCCTECQLLWLWLVLTQYRLIQMLFISINIFITNISLLFIYRVTKPDVH